MNHKICQTAVNGYNPALFRFYQCRVYVFCVCLPDPGEAFIITQVHLSLPLGYLLVNMIPVRRENCFTQATLQVSRFAMVGKIIEKSSTL